ncbi:hypothetical protein [uncultured Roseobacter sp.]|uniref:hypothetical protein n=1 Tax=uncultured Roseobacter sp. TaxID=114847 RepID=UPI0026046F99|nr:hypothetical protein [uncultured Roseobacter sp.]
MAPRLVWYLIVALPLDQKVNTSTTALRAGDRTESRAKQIAPRVFSGLRDQTLGYVATLGDIA